MCFCVYGYIYKCVLKERYFEHFLSIYSMSGMLYSDDQISEIAGEEKHLNRGLSHNMAMHSGTKNL